ncbi:hypothetical protein RM780_23290 [Streptomyces sp. DSM 44917]|uniref:Integral membrane protein n=1 Tax=Streptomyces boetiae TaxID=3075541 RepID=A0ABU2LE67_9ACTN|nr:hypothetical protein [Streptomyces sp. DSM 44917]MDT0309856.1 hypothetical protein [Streptomyces sp. DSM 44917]
MRAGADLRMLRAAVFAAACTALGAAGHVSAAGGGIPLPALAAGWAVAFAAALPLTGRERRSVPAIAALLAAGQLGLHLLLTVLAGHGGHGGHGRSLAGASGHGGHGPGGEVLALAGRLLCNDRLLGLTEAEAARIVAAAGLGPGGPGSAAGGTAGAGAGVKGATSGATSAGADPGGVLDAVAGAGAFAGLTPAMVLGHLLAALAAGWLLRRGEAALWRLVRLSARRTCPPSLRRALRLAFLLHGARRPAGSALRARGARSAEPPPADVAPPGSVTRRGPPPGAADAAQGVGTGVATGVVAGIAPGVRRRAVPSAATGVVPGAVPGVVGVRGGQLRLGLAA